jgi:acetamidase/formamidase
MTTKINMKTSSIAKKDPVQPLDRGDAEQVDIRDIAEGTELYLPVEVAGGIFSVGDTHAAQGDGEVCGTAIESAMDVAFKFEGALRGESSAERGSFVLGGGGSLAPIAKTPACRIDSL